MEKGRTKEGTAELKTLQQMVTNWRESYANQNDGTGGWEFLVEDFKKEILEQVVPYVRRLQEIESISPAQAHGFLGWCCEQESELLRELSNG